MAATRGRTEPFPDALHEDVVAALDRSGIHTLYSFQRQALQAVLDGRSVVLSGGTGSGKSLCYQLPILNLLRTTRTGRALYLAPTKALAHDQARRVRELRCRWAQPALYDGDTPPRQRGRIRNSARLVLSNPDMLSAGILPRHAEWAEFLAALQVVVIDEAHMYRGVFGSHVAHVIRRLRRLCTHYGSAPVFVASSGTIANPVEHVEHLTGCTPELIGDHGAPSGARTIVLWNPEYDEALEERDSALADTARIYAQLLEDGLGVIVFARSRRQCELLHQFTVERLRARGRTDLIERIAPYRAGYTPEERRTTERALARGELLGVVATNALEVGIDIGSLDAVICSTFPGSVTSMWQQWGRAGRGRGAAIAVLVAGDDALDQYFMRLPDELLGRPLERAVISTTNQRILLPHLAAAACELPVGGAVDESLWAEALHPAIAQLAAAGTLAPASGGGFAYVAGDSPIGTLSLRSGGRGEVIIVEADTGVLLGTVEMGRAPTTLHPGAVYLHAGSSYVITDLDMDRGVATAQPETPPYYTLPKVDTGITVLETYRIAQYGDLTLHFGAVEVTDQLLAYQRKSVTTQSVIDLVPCQLPPVTCETEAIWFAAPESAVQSLDTEQLLGALHAAEHGMIALLPLLAMCDRADIGGLSTNYHDDVGGAAIFVYDGHDGGVGLAETGFAQFRRWVDATLAALTACPCADGCPSCVQSPKCGNLNEPLDKRAAIAVLTALCRATAGDNG